MAKDSGYATELDGGHANHVPADMGLAGTAATLRIATLNLQNFGPAKAARVETLQAFADVIRGFGLVAVQEIQDTTGQAPRNLLAALNTPNPDAFAMLLSENTGREPSDRNFRERYAFFYRTAVVSVATPPQLFDDAASDLCNRYVNPTYRAAPQSVRFTYRLPALASGVHCASRAPLARTRWDQRGACLSPCRSAR